LFLFKFVTADGKHEPEQANRLWPSHDGAELWVHSESAPIGARPPIKQTVAVRYLSPGGGTSARMHL